MLKIIRILFILSSVSLLLSQTTEDLKKFMDTYDKLKVDQQANEIVKKGIESEKDPTEGPVRLLINPGDMTKYYNEKMNVIKKDLEKLNRLLISADSISPLEHFGYKYFSLRDSIQFIDNANVSSNYILGYGDEVIISIWGQAEQHDRQTLERDGTVFIKNVGLLYLGGKTQSQAKSYIRERFSKVYASLSSNPPLTYLEFSIGKIKNINITVSGQVQFPGNYVVNPSISISNILILSGGITEKGTLRNILLQRADVFVDTLDLYPLITGVGLTKQVTISESDIIVVPARGETVAVTGDVLNPAYFEVNPEDNILSLLRYAGVGNYKANKQAIIARPGASNLYVSKSDFDKTLLFHRDSLIIPLDYYPIKSISISVTNHPVIHIPWIHNLSFNQIISIVNVDSSNVSGVELIRRSLKDNNQKPHPFDPTQNKDFIFFPDDHVSIHLFEKFTATKTVIVRGEVNYPGTYPLINHKESLNSILNRAGGLQGGPTAINNVIIKRDTLLFGSQSGELLLSPGDTVIARPLTGTIQVKGEVHNPGNFEWSANITAKDYLSFAGGLTSIGDKKHIVYITPYGEASRISSRSNVSILPGSIIHVSEKPLSERAVKPDRVQQISSFVTSLVSIAILANTINK